MVRIAITFVFALLVSVASEVGSAAAKNWNTGSSNQPFKQVKKLPPFTNINESTERFRRTQIFCKIAKEPKLKPFPKGIDDFRSSSDFMTYADLFGDGTIELITGVNDSAYIADSQSFPNEGNKERATKPIPHLLSTTQVMERAREHAVLVRCGEHWTRSLAVKKTEALL